LEPDGLHYPDPAVFHWIKPAFSLSLRRLPLETPAAVSLKQPKVI